MSTTTPPKDVESFIEPWKEKKGNLIMILHDMQDYYGFVPKEEAYKLAKAMGIPLARIYEVLTFYNYFRLSPPGKYTISVCLGTACYLKGAPDIIKQVTLLLDIEEDETTKDGLFELKVVRCLGCCGLAPVVTVNETVYSAVDSKKIKQIIKKYQKEG